MKQTKKDNNKKSREKSKSWATNIWEKEKRNEHKRLGEYIQPIIAVIFDSFFFLLILVVGNKSVEKNTWKPNNKRNVVVH